MSVWDITGAVVASCVIAIAWVNAQESKLDLWNLRRWLGIFCVGLIWDVFCLGRLVEAHL